MGFHEGVPILINKRIFILTLLSLLANNYIGGLKPIRGEYYLNDISSIHRY